MRQLMVLIGAGLFLLLLAYLQYTGRLWYTTLFTLPHKTKGLDVSHYQGDIDWKRVAATDDYSFVFIKATEGHDFIDDTFSKNWSEARDNGIAVGAYHFFSMRSPGAEQAEYFIQTVPKEEGSLSPVIDIEIRLDHDPVKVRGELQSLSDALENHYNQTPILYVTYDTYNAYVKNYFTNHRIWIRDIYKFPTLGTRKWVLWQYNNRGRVDGISTYVDINVLSGDVELLK